MKLTKNIFAILIAVFVSTIAHGQNEGRNQDMYMEGKWTASCATEIQDHASMKHCELCPFVINPNNKSQARIKDIGMNFFTDSIAFNQDGKMSTVPFRKNKDNHSFSFTLNNKQYDFRMFLWEEQRIIEDSDGMILVLTKSKE
jgi:hypothetical protein